MPETKRESRWKMAVWCIVLLPVLYWFSAPVTLWGWKHTRSRATPYSDAIPVWWCKVYAPVLWAADHPTFWLVTMKPFEWLGVDENLYNEIVYRPAERVSDKVDLRPGTP